MQGKVTCVKYKCWGQKRREDLRIRVLSLLRRNMQRVDDE